MLQRRVSRLRSKNESISKSWFCVFANPEKHGYDGTPQEIVHKIIGAWILDNPQRTCAVSYCISADGLPHLHAVFEDTKSMRFSAIKKLFPSWHLEPTKGDKKSAEDYILKRPPYDEIGEEIVYIGRHGEIKGRQGARNDLAVIEELIQQGKTPNEIFDLSLQYRKHEKIIRSGYYRKRYRETPTMRPVTVHWHVGDSGSGKSYTEVKLAEIHGEDSIFKASGFEWGFADLYSGQPIFLADDVRPDDKNLSYKLLLVLLDAYKSQVHARFQNVYSLWDEVHITSVFPPEVFYRDLNIRNREIDTYEQLRRRIDFVVYHYVKDGEYLTHEVPMGDYTGYADLKACVAAGSDWVELPIDTFIPWNETGKGE